ncbi:glycogen debranching N-terminal domain-containing protein [Agrococcus sp. Ld7]|uniref:glycogen debranching N-terminal domain-containing protein n=1 Tax=Agrococcus sp. Ld7 TaxID=649148 RepID=UPI0038667730
MRAEPVGSGVHVPLLHRELVALAAPTQVWSAQDGTMTGGAHGVFHGDWRYVTGLELLIDRLPVAPISTSEDPDWFIFRAVPLDPETGRPRSRVTIERMREVAGGAVTERVTLVNGGGEAIDAVIELSCEVAFTPVASVRAGSPAPVPISLEMEGDEVLVTDGTRTLRARSRGGHLRIDGNRIVVAQEVHVAHDDWFGITLELELIDSSLVLHGTDGPPLADELPRSGRPALDRWMKRAVADLDNLSLDAGHGAFPAAGAPWHMTLVARDALIASRLLLPISTGLAEGTLRTLAARQGVQLDPVTGEQPGRILHSMQQGVTDALRPGVEAPPVYAGSTDATPLWIVLLHDAWEAGMPLETVRELRTALHAALAWMRAATGDGFLACTDERGMGVAGKHWTDDAAGMRCSTDEVGVATAQVQGLACRAAVGAARLLDALGDDGEPMRLWARRLRERFRAQFWVQHEGIRFPAMALDARGRPFETLVSDIGQLIGTTLLDRGEEETVARLLLDDRLSSGFGLRTMATDADRYWPLAHYCGAIWPHDTAIAIEGLLRSGFGDEARNLAEQLERAAGTFDGRMPEVYAGYGMEDTPVPIPHPAACSPHAWASAAVIPVRTALLEGSASTRPHDRVAAVVGLVAHRSVDAPMRSTPPAPSRSRAHLHLVPSAPSALD